MAICLNDVQYLVDKIIKYRTPNRAEGFITTSYDASQDALIISYKNHKVCIPNNDVYQCSSNTELFLLVCEKYKTLFEMCDEKPEKEKGRKIIMED